MEIDFRFPFLRVVELVVISCESKSNRVTPFIPSEKNSREESKCICLLWNHLCRFLAPNSVNCFFETTPTRSFRPSFVAKMLDDDEELDFF